MTNPSPIPTPLGQHYQKEQVQAEGFVWLIKDINLWITAYKKLSPNPRMLKIDRGQSMLPSKPYMTIFCHTTLTQNFNC